MTDDPKERKQDGKPRSHRLLWLVVGVFLVLAIGGMWAIDYFYSPEALAAHKVHDAVDD